MPVNLNARVECKSSVIASDPYCWRPAQEMFVSLYQFLTVTCGLTVIASSYGNFGPGVLGNAFQIWELPESASNIHCYTNAWFVVEVPFATNWKYYLYVQWCGVGSSTGFTTRDQNADDANPSLVFNAYNFYSLNHITIQAALGISSLGVSFNPWNGTADADGADTKGSPVWKTDAGGYTWVFPRSNNTPGGTNLTVRDNNLCVYTTYYNSVTNVYSRWHFFMTDAGELALVVCPNERDYPTEFVTTYVGPYTPLPGVISIPNPLMMISWSNMNYDSPYHPYIGEWFGNLNENNSQCMGGIFTTMGGTGGGVRSVFLDSLVNQTMYPNTNFPSSPILEAKIPLRVGELQNPGLVGHLDTPLIRCIYGCPANYGNIAGTRIAMGTDTGVAQWRFTFPWDGTDPGSGTVYTGHEFTASW